MSNPPAMPDYPQQYGHARSQWLGVVSVVWFKGYAIGKPVGPDKIALKPRPGYPEGQFLTVLT